MLNKRRDSPFNSFFQFKNAKLEKDYGEQDQIEKKRYLMFLSVIQLINSFAYIFEEKDYSYFAIAYFCVIITTNLIAQYLPKFMPYAIFVDQLCSCYFASRQINHINNSYSSFQQSVFFVGQSVGQYLLLGGSNILLDTISIASSQIVMLVLLSDKKIYSNIILVSLIFTFSFYKFLHNQNERNYFYQKHQNQQWMQVIDKTIQNEILIANLESGHLQLHDLNKKAKNFKIHENQDEFTLFLENMIIDKKKSQISIDTEKMQNSLKSYMLVRLSNLHEQEEGQKINNKSPPKQLNIRQQSKSISQQKQLNEVQVVVNKNGEGQKYENEFTYFTTLHPKNESQENKKTISNIKSLIRKKSDSRKLNVTSIVTKQNPSSTRPSKASDSKVNTQIDTFGANNHSNAKQDVFAKEQSSIDIIYCDYKVDEKVVKKYKISISVLQTNQYLLVLSFEENIQDSQRELKKQNETLNKILIKSHLGYIQKQQNQLQNLNEMNYGDLKLNQYLHMNSVFSITQYIYLQKRNKMPIKVQEFNINNLIDNVKSIFPQLQLVKDYNGNEINKLLIRNDYHRVIYIIVSILSSVFFNSKSSFNDTPHQRNRMVSNYSNANQMKVIGTPKGQMISPSQSGGRQVEQMNSQKIEETKQGTANKDQDLSLQKQENVRNLKHKNLNKFFIEMEQEESQKVVNKLQEVNNKTKFGTPKHLHANYLDSNEELINNLSLTKERNRRAFIDGQSRAESNINGMNNNSDLILNQLLPEKNNTHLNSFKSNQNTQEFNLQKYCKRDNNINNNYNNNTQNQSKLSDKQILQKNTEEIEFQSNYQETQQEQSDRFDIEEARNTFTNNRQIGDELEQSSVLNTPQMTVKLIEKQKEYQKDYFQIIIAFQQLTQQNTPVTQNCQEKKPKLNMRGLSSVLNSVIGNPNEIQQQQSKTQYSNTNNSVLDQDYGKKIYDNDQTLNDWCLFGPSTHRNTENNESPIRFQNLNGNQDDLINQIEEKILLECIKQVCNSALDYKIDKSGNHIVTFSILSDLPLSQVNNQIIPDKKRAISIHSMNSNPNNLYYQGSQSINSMVFGQKERLRSLNSNMSTNVNTIQQFQPSIQSLKYYPNQGLNNGSTQNPGQQNVYKVLNQKGQQNQIKNILKQNTNNQIATIINGNSNPQFSPQLYCRKRQTSLPAVSDKLLGYFDIKEDESLENNANNSNEYIKNKQKQDNYRKNSTSMTSLEKSPSKRHIFHHKAVQFEKLQQVVASSTLLSENKFNSPKNMHHSMLSGSCLAKNKQKKNTEKRGTYFKDFIELSKQIDASLNEQSLQIESERKEENFENPKAFEYSMKRDQFQYE